MPKQCVSQASGGKGLQKFSTQKKILTPLFPHSNYKISCLAQHNDLQKDSDRALVSKNSICSKNQNFFGIVISHTPCQLLAEPPESNEKTKGCRAN